MKFTNLFHHKVASAVGALVAVSIGATQAGAATNGLNSKAVKSEVRNENGRYVLYVDQKPFFIKGAGLEFGSQESLSAHGGNSFRTWRTENGRESGQAVLDRAYKNHLFVTMGLDIERERHGFDYNDDAAVKRQFEDVKAQILKFKDHPALMAWAIGNELNLNSKNPKVWNAVNNISKLIHQIDPNHLTTTPIAGISKELVASIKARAPDLDFLSIQMYADIINLPRYLREAEWTGPYVVTEWGATGHWEAPKASWGAPVENDSTVKANLYLKRYQTAIAADQKQCLGSYVFLWGQKQERTPTWYGMFLDSGEETATVDALHYIWNGRWPSNRSPRINGAWVNGKTARDDIHLQPGAKCTAKLLARDPDNDALKFSWQLLPESTDLGFGGDFETRPAAIEGLIDTASANETSFKAPDKPGAYRLFAYVFDGHNHAAHVNIPFFVDAATIETLQTAGK